jgi:hypothetical protein
MKVGGNRAAVASSRPSLIWVLHGQQRRDRDHSRPGMSDECRSLVKGMTLTERPPITLSALRIGVGFPGVRRIANKTSALANAGPMSAPATRLLISSPNRCRGGSVRLNLLSPPHHIPAIGATTIKPPGSTLKRHSCRASGRSDRPESGRSRQTAGYAYDRITSVRRAAPLRLSDRRCRSPR